MDPIYHIETDLKCKVYHFGTEVCIATPGEDATITLRKGRHKLSFVSCENPADQYSILFPVEETGIEDFIEVSLSGIRNNRLVEEEKIRIENQKRLAEAERLRQLEIARKEAEERARIAQEEKMRQQEILKERYKRLATIFREAKEYDDRYWGSWSEDYTLFPYLFENNKIGFINNKGKTIIKPRFFKSRGKWGFSEGLGVVWEPVFICFNESLLNQISIFTFNGKLNFLGGSPLGVYMFSQLSYINGAGKKLELGNYLIDTNTCNGAFFSQDRAVVVEYQIREKKTIWALDDDRAEKDYPELFQDSPTRAIYDLPQERQLNVIFVSDLRIVIIDKSGKKHGYVPLRDNCLPYFNPYRQGLSVVAWKNIDVKSSEGWEFFDVIDREGNLVISYDVRDKHIQYQTLYGQPRLPIVFISGRALVASPLNGKGYLLELDGSVHYAGDKYFLVGEPDTLKKRDYIIKKSE